MSVKKEQYGLLYDPSCKPTLHLEEDQQSAVVLAQAYAPGMMPSEVYRSDDVTGKRQVELPRILTQSYETESRILKVDFDCSTSNAEIWYTTDGNTVVSLTTILR